MALTDLAHPPLALGNEPPSDSTDDHIITRLHLGHGCKLPKPESSTQERLDPGLSVAVCTYKRAKSLERFLDSLAAQDLTPSMFVIVDASPDDETEQMVARRSDVESLAGCLHYFRVSGPLKGLTHQRNFALRWVSTDLIAFFDDDIVLLPGCLSELTRVHRLYGEQVVGVGSYINGDYTSWRYSLVWRMNLLLRMVSNLQPGRYHRSGITTLWSFMTPTDALVEGDWLPGGATIWKTTVARDLGFYGGFGGYALGEDLDFSLRAGRKGKLILAGAARVLHLDEASGRSNPFELGYMEIYNRYQIHRRGLRDRTWRDIAWFGYAWTLDTLLLMGNLLSASRVKSTLRQAAGRCKGAYDIIRGR